jgi:hypothetical protein
LSCFEKLWRGRINGGLVVEHAGGDDTDNGTINYRECNWRDFISFESSLDGIRACYIE